VEEWEAEVLGKLIGIVWAAGAFGGAAAAAVAADR